jgi:hypothetical protein
MRFLRRGPALASAPALLAVAALAVAGWGRGGPDAGAAVSACAGGSPLVTRPAALPRSFRFPRGTVLTVARRQAGATVVEGVAPGTIASVRRFYLGTLRASGYRLYGGEVEVRDAETDFAANGVTGRLKLGEIAGCRGVVAVAVAVRR